MKCLISGEEIDNNKQFLPEDPKNPISVAAAAYAEQKHGEQLAKWPFVTVSVTANGGQNVLFAGHVSPSVNLNDLALTVKGK